MNEIVQKSMKWDDYNDMKSYRNRLDDDAKAFIDTFISTEVFKRHKALTDAEVDAIDATHRAHERDIYSPYIRPKDKKWYPDTIRNDLSTGILNRLIDTELNPEQSAIRNDIKKIIKSAKNKSDEKTTLYIGKAK